MPAVPASRSHELSPGQFPAFDAAHAKEAEDESPSAGGGTGDALEDAARRERDYVRERLKEELRREPTDEEVSEWLRRHTEGY